MRFGSNLLLGNYQLPFLQHKDLDGFWIVTSMMERDGILTTRKESAQLILMIDDK